MSKIKILEFFRSIILNKNLTEDWILGHFSNLNKSEARHHIATAKQIYIKIYHNYSRFKGLFLIN